MRKSFKLRFPGSDLVLRGLSLCLLLAYMVGGHLYAQDPQIVLRMIAENGSVEDKQSEFRAKVLNARSQDISTAPPTNKPDFDLAFLHLLPKMEEVYILEIEQGKQKMTVFLDLFFVGTRFLALEVGFEPGQHCFRLLDLPVEARKETIPINTHFKRKCACKKTMKTLEKRRDGEHFAD